jgi:hypothetical protein
MRRDISIKIAPEADTKKEMSVLSLHFADQHEDVVLDINAAALLKVSRIVPDLGQDFLCIASCIYAADKAVARNETDDKWTRHLAIEIPVEHVDTWTGVADELSNCIGFLTGDRWEISFRHWRKAPGSKETATASCSIDASLEVTLCAYSQVGWILLSGQ